MLFSAIVWKHSIAEFLLTFLSKNGTMLYNYEAYRIIDLVATTMKRLGCIISRVGIMMRVLVGLLMRMIQGEDCQVNQYSVIWDKLKMNITINFESTKMANAFCKSAKIKKTSSTKVSFSW